MIKYRLVTDAEVKEILSLDEHDTKAEAIGEIKGVGPGTYYLVQIHGPIKYTQETRTVDHIDDGSIRKRGPRKATIANAAKTAAEKVNGEGVA